MYAAVPITMPACVDWAVIVGEEVTSGDEPSGLSAFASPKSRTLTDAVRRALHVGRLQVPMDDALLVRRLERVGDLARDLERLVDGHGTLRDPLRESLAFDELQHEPAHAARLLEPVNVRDVGMIEGGQHLGLALEAREPFGIRGERLREDLDRDVASELRVLRPVNLSHASRAERREDLVGSEARAGERAS